MARLASVFPETDRLVVHQFDPDRPTQGGIDTCIADLVKYSPDGYRIALVGVTSDRVPLGRWRTVTIFGRDVAFMPVARLSAGDQARRIPHSARVAAGLLLNVPHVPPSCRIQVHRLDMGAVVSLRYPRTGLIQFIHTPTHESMGTASDSYWRFANALQPKVAGVALRRAREIRVFNRNEASRLAESGLPAHRCLTWFDPDLHFPAPHLRSSGINVAWVGRLEHPKDPVLAARTFATAYRSGAVDSLTVIGDGTLRTHVEEAVTAEGIANAVTFTGLVSRSAVAEQLRRADVALMTSHFEGSPRALIEALACGTPVATTAGGDPDGLIVDDVNGCVAVSREPADLVSALLRAARAKPRDCAASVAALNAVVAVRSLFGPTDGTSSAGL